MAIRKMKETVDILKDENLELKLSDVRKDVRILEELNTTQHSNLFEGLQRLEIKLEEVLGHVRATNGSVARVQEQANNLEAAQKEHDEFRDGIEQLKDETKDIRWFMKHPKLWYTISLILIVTLANSEVLDRIIKLAQKWF